MAFPSPPPKYAIYPGVGIARLGDSEEYYLGPDVATFHFSPSPLPPPGSAPGTAPTAAPGEFRDSAGRILRQAALFRVYEVTWRKFQKGWVPHDAKVVKASGTRKLVWSVDVANKKTFRPPPAPTSRPVPMADRVTNDASGTISSTSPAGTVVDLTGGVKPLRLAQLVTHPDGHLIILPGSGQCIADPIGTPLAGLFTPDWFDDVCDGVVHCNVIEGGVTTAALPAWVVTGKPDFAHAVPPIVSLYDVAEWIAVDHKKWPFDRKPSFVKDIHPLLFTIAQQQWTTHSVRLDPPAVSLVGTGHVTVHVIVSDGLALSQAASKSDVAGRSYRRAMWQRLLYPMFPPHTYTPVGAVFEEDYYVALTNMTTVWLKPILDAETGALPPPVKTMPRQWSLTCTGPQYYRLWAWYHNQYNDDYAGPGLITPLPPPPQPALSSFSGASQLDQLNRAHMGWMTGGSTMPGLEVGWRALLPQNWAIAFRIDHTTVTPGELTSSLSIPWPYDYQACGVTAEGTPVTLDWWPAGRPTSVFDSTGAETDWDADWRGTIEAGWKTLKFIKWDSVLGKYRAFDK